VSWMEENPEQLRGKQAVWHKDVKDQVFKNDEHVTVKRICGKAANMRRQWRDTSAMRNRSGWGISEDQNERSINQALEKKCAFFWQLDAIWGIRPNVIMVVIHKTSHPASGPPSNDPSARDICWPWWPSTSCPCHMLSTIPVPPPTSIL